MDTKKKRHVGLALAPCLSRRGFTLVELVVAAGITVALAAVMIGLVANLMSHAGRMSGNLLANNQAKFALDILAEDLAGALFRNDGNVWMAATVTPDGELAAHGWIHDDDEKPDEASLDPDVPIVENRFGRGGVWLRMITTSNDQRQAEDDTIEDYSAPCAVAYQIVRRHVTPSTDSGVRYMLFRSDVRATTRDPEIEPGVNPEPQDAGTFQVGYDLHPEAANAYAAAENTLARNPGTIVLPHLNTAVAQDVIDFGVRLLAVDGTVLFPTTTPLHLEHLSRVGGDAFPAAVEIHLRILTQDGAHMIEALEVGRITSGDWWQIAVEHSQVYTRRVEIRAQPI